MHIFNPFTGGFPATLLTCTTTHTLREVVVKQFNKVPSNHIPNDR